MPRIAIVHYHLRSGGVTRVIQHAVAGLRAARCRVAVLAGAAPEAGFFQPGEVRIVPALDYPAAAISGRAPALADALQAAARAALGGPPDIWHFHNHTLGKNTALAQAVYRMAGRGLKMLLQIHDFPEDGRPANFRALLQDVGGGQPARLAACLYPRASHVHYATINNRDRIFLCRAGMPEARVHLLPNAVDLGDGRAMPKTPPGGGGRLFVYPTRALRRKNVGEFLLWSALAEPGDYFATTLAPTGAADRCAYQEWVALARQLKLPVAFGIGRKSPRPFPALLASATAVATTSVAEGFGLAFLEPWLVKAPLVGRDLPEITGDFKEHQIRLDGLYRRLLIPRDWINLDALRRKITSGYGRWLSAYRRTATRAGAELALRAAMQGNRVDFGRLDEELQAGVIRRLKRSPGMRSEISPRRLLGAAPSPAAIIRNRAIILRNYGKSRYRRDLERLYALVAESGRGQLDAISMDGLLDCFLVPERFYLLRT